MRRNICFLTAFVLLLISLSSCAGYNRLLRETLSNPESYQTYSVTVADVYYAKPNTQEKLRDFEITDYSMYVTYVVVRFVNKEDVRIFLGASPNAETALEDYEFALETPAANSQILYENGFFKDVSVGDRITLTASSFIYMDGKFFFIAQVEKDGVEYLTFDEGLQNIKDHMNRNKSLF